MQITRRDIVSGLPDNFEGSVSSMTPMEGTRLMLVSVDYDGVDLLFAISKEAAAEILTRRGVELSNPGEDIPKPKPRTSSSPRLGPKVGEEKRCAKTGKRKRVVRYDFTTPRLRGKRRVTCPDTGKKGFPVWEVL